MTAEGIDMSMANLDSLELTHEGNKLTIKLLDNLIPNTVLQQIDFVQGDGNGIYRFKFNMHPELTITSSAHGGEAPALADDYRIKLMVPFIEEENKADFTQPVNGTFWNVEDWEADRLLDPEVLYNIKQSVNGDVTDLPQVKHNQTITQPADPVVTGYTFEGWLLEDVAYDFETKVQKDTTLVADMQLVDYQVTYHNVEAGEHSNSLSYTVESTAEELALGDPTARDYYTFGGWYQDQEFTDPALVSIPANMEAPANLDIYAKWVPITYEIELVALYNGEIQDVTLDPLTITVENLPYTLTPLTAEQLPEGKVFDEWFFDEALTQPVEIITEDNFASLVAEGARKLYAKLSLATDTKYPVHFMYGTEEIRLANITNGSPVNPDIANQNLETHLDGLGTGYELDYWHLEGETEEYDWTLPVTGELTLYAAVKLKKYEVTFNLDGGKVGELTEITVDPVTHGEKVDNPGDAEKANTRFLGWFVEDATEAYDFDTPVTGALVLTAKYQAQVTVTLDPGANGSLADGVEVAYTIDKGEEFAYPADAVANANYEFVEWQLAGAKYVAQAINEDTTLVAVYRQVANVTYHLYDGSNDPANAEKLYELPFELKPATKEGYRFLGWYSDAEFTNKVSELTDFKDYELHAKFEQEYEVTYELNGGALASGEENPAKVIASELPIDLSIPSKEGYEFDGWYSEADFINKVTQIKNVENLAFYAKFTKLHALTLGDKLESDQTDNNAIRHGTEVVVTIEVPDNNEVKTLMVIVGEESVDKASEVVNNKYTFTIEADTDIQVTFDLVNHLVTFDLNGGKIGESADNPTAEVKHGSVVPEGSRPANPELAKHRFLGWYLGEDKVDLATYAINEPTTLVAKYQAQVTVTLDPGANGSLADGVEVAYTIDKGEEFAYPADAVANANYEFVEWQLAGAKYVAQAINEDTTLVAVYRQVANVTYHLYDGSNDPANAEKLYELPFELKPATKEGYRFLGWYSDAEFTNKVSELTDFKDYELHAKFEQEYEVTYELNGGALASGEENPAKVIASELPIDLSIPSKEGYEFDGWYSEADFINKVTQIKNVENLAFYAKFTKLHALTLGDKLESDQTDNNAIRHGTEVVVTIEVPDNNEVKTLMVIVGEESVDKASEVVNNKYTFTIEADTDIQVTFDLVNHLVTFDLNGGKIGESADNPTAEVKHGSVVPEGSRPANPTKDGYRFDNWYVGEEVFEFDTPVTEDLTVTARFEKEHAVTYVLDGGALAEGVSNPDVIVESEIPITLEEPSKEGYRFDGWYTESEFTNKVTQITSVENLAFYAKFTKLYKLIYDENTLELVSTNPADANLLAAPEGTEATFKVINIPENQKIKDIKDGEESVLSYYNADENKLAVMIIDADMDLTVEFEDIMHLVLFDLNGGTIDGASEFAGFEVKQGSVIPIDKRPAEPERGKYTFDGWLDSAENEVDFETYVVSDETTITAQWLEPYEVSFALDGGNIDGSTADIDVLVKRDTVIPAEDLPADPVKEGYRFDGWVDLLNEEVSYDFTNLVIEEGMAVIAKWVEQVTVTLDSGTNGSLASGVEAINTIDKGAEFAYPAAAVANEGYEFVEWQLAGAKYVAQVINENITLVAKYNSLAFNITYEFNKEGATHTNLETHIPGTALQLEDASLDNYKFAGWYSDAEYTTAITEIPASQAEDLTVYGKFDVYTLAELLALADNEQRAVEVTMALVDPDDDRNFWIEDGETQSLIHVSAGYTAHTFNQGDRVELIATKGTYENLPQITAIEYVQTVQTNYPLETLTEVDGFGSITMETLHHRYDIINVEFVSYSNRNAVFKDTSNNQMTVRINHSDDTEFETYLDNLIVGRKYKIVGGAVAQYENAPQIMVVNIDQVVYDDISDAEIVALVKEEVLALTIPAEVDSGTLHGLPEGSTENPEATITWSTNPAGLINGNSWGIVDTDTQVQLIATITCGEVSDTVDTLETTIKQLVVTYDVTVTGDGYTTDPATLTDLEPETDVTFTFEKDGYILDKVLVDNEEVIVTDNSYVLTVTANHEVEVKWIMTIATARAQSKGTQMETIGIVTGIQRYADGNRRTVIISDETAAIHLYKPIDGAGVSDVAIGDKIRVSGTKDVYNGLEQFGREGTIEEIISSNNPLPEGTHLRTIAGLTEADQGKRVTVEGLKVTSVEDDNIIVSDETNTVRVDLYEAPASYTTLFGSLQVGDFVDLNGIHVGWFNGLQLNPYGEGEVVEHELTDQEKVDAVKQYLLDTYNDQEVSKGTDMLLPLPTILDDYEGVTISWKTNGALVDGVWLDVSEDTSKVLTATITSGDVTETQEVTVLVKAEVVEEEYTGTISNIGPQTNTGIDDGEISTHSNIDIVNNGENAISVVYESNGTNNTIFNNGFNEIRLYKGSGNGGQLTISVEGALITSIKFNLTKNKGMTINGGEEITDSAIEITYEGEEAIVIKNVSNDNLQIASPITITYKTDEGVTPPPTTVEDKYDATKAEIAELFPTDPIAEVRKGTSANLPTTGTQHNDVTIEWSYEPSDAVDLDGNWKQVTEDTLVTLEARYSVETSEPVTETYQVWILAEDTSDPQIIHQSDFGTTNGWSSYGIQSNKPIDLGSLDPNAPGTTNWDILGGNVDTTQWDYIRMGGKLASSLSDPQAYLETKFTFEGTIDNIVINIVGLDSAIGNETIHLQTSTDGTKWTTVASEEITAVGDLTFDNLNIAPGNYFKFVFERQSTDKNKGTDVKTITFNGFPN